MRQQLRSGAHLINTMMRENPAKSAIQAGFTKPSEAAALYTKGVLNHQRHQPRTIFKPASIPFACACQTALGAASCAILNNSSSHSSPGAPASTKQLSIVFSLRVATKEKSSKLHIPASRAEEHKLSRIVIPAIFTLPQTNSLTNAAIPSERVPQHTEPAISAHSDITAN